MQYLLRCECGRQLVVTDVVPGKTITCSCGRVLRVADDAKSVVIDDSNVPGQQSIPRFWRTLHQLTPRCFVTQTMFWLNIAVFAGMVLAGVNFFSPAPDDMIRWGANFGPATLSGEYWRLLTCTFLHFGVLHIACNMWALWNVGFLVERLVGNVGFLILYLVSGLFGSVAMLLTRPETLSAGASGAIFGVIGALFGFVILRRDTVPPRILKSLRSSSLTFIIINLVLTFSIPGIGVAGHVGGLAAGFCCGLALSQPILPEAKGRRLLRNILVAAGGASAIVGAFLLIPRPEINLKKEVTLLVGEDLGKTEEIYFDARDHSRQGAISKLELAEIVERDVLPEWRNLTKRVSEIQNVPDAQKPLLALYLDYFNAKRRSWEFLVESIKENDPNKSRLSELQEELANEASLKVRDFSLR
jgi:rhomboid protease GluP